MSMVNYWNCMRCQWYIIEADPEMMSLIRCWSQVGAVMMNRWSRMKSQWYITGAEPETMSMIH